MKQTAGNPVDSGQKPAIPRLQNSPHRRFEREALPIGIANPRQDMSPIAISAANRIRSNRHDRQVGSWLFGSNQGQVYVLPEDSCCARRMLREHPKWVVGRYAAEASDRKRPKCPTAVHVCEDLRQHFMDLGLSREADMYAADRKMEW